MVLQHLLMDSGLKAQDIIAKYYQQGISLENIPVKALKEALLTNEMVGCFRKKPDALANIDGIQIHPILVVRDPRDCYLSWYYARHLHPEARIDNDDSLEQFLETKDSFDDDVCELLDFTKNTDGLILKYEDIGYSPVSFLQDFAEYSKLPFTRSAIDNALINTNFFQLARSNMDHNRSGAVYQAITTLPEEILSKLNERFAHILEQLNYPFSLEALPLQQRVDLIERDAMKRYMLQLASENAARCKEIAELTECVENLRRNLDTRTSGGSWRILQLVHQAVGLPKKIWR